MAATTLRLSLCTAAALFAGAAWADEGAAAGGAPVDRYVFFGFGPFAGRQENASWQSVKQFADGVQVQAMEVPVVWGAPRAKLLEAGKLDGRVVLVALGEGKNSYEVETVGFNERTAIRDESGKQPAEQTIVPGGEGRLELQGPAAKIAEKMTATGFPAHVSKDAGRFLCNEMLYELLRAQRENPKIAAVYFIHVPVLGSTLLRDGKGVTVTPEYCGEFGRALLSAVRELHPMAESATAAAR